jgi:hypothetical protein
MPDQRVQARLTPAPNIGEHRAQGVALTFDERRQRLPPLTRQPLRVPGVKPVRDGHISRRRPLRLQHLHSPTSLVPPSVPIEPSTWRAVPTADLEASTAGTTDLGSAAEPGRLACLASLVTWDERPAWVVLRTGKTNGKIREDLGR